MKEFVKMGNFVRVWVTGVFSLFLVSTSIFAATPAKMIEFWNDFEEDSQMQVDHSRLQSLFDEYLDDQHSSGIYRFDYEAVTPGDRQKLKAYLDYLQLMDPRQLNRAEAKAFWVNLFNAVTLDAILDDYASSPVESIRDVRSGMFTPGPWERKSVTLLTKELSLEQIQNGVLRAIWQDPRIHFALVYASLGSPNMPKTVLDGDNNEALLNEWQDAFLKHSRAVRVENDEIVLSRIFDWYDTDFAQDREGLLRYLSQYTTDAMARVIGNLSDVRFEYDWTLNSPSAE